MKHHQNMSAPHARLHWKTTWVMALALFLLAPCILGSAASRVPNTGASRYPAITIYVGSG